MINLLSGMLVAAAVFAAVIWSLFQIVTMRGRLQWAHIGVAILSLAGMGAVSAILPTVAMIIGFLLGVNAIIVIMLEERWSKLFPAFQLAFAITLILGLPFSGN